MNSLKKKKNEPPDENPIINLFKPHTSLDKDKNHIYFYSDVDQYSCLELNKKINDLNKELLQHAIEYEVEPPNIYLHINSFGGSLFAAFSTIDTILNSKIPIISIIEGCAASAATIISIVCHKRYCTANSFMLIHQLSTGAMGKYEEMKDDFLNDTKLMELLYKLYKNHTKMDLKTIKRVLKRDLWWESNECLKNGLIDEIWLGSKININIQKEFSVDTFKTKHILKKRKIDKINKTNQTDKIDKINQTDQIDKIEIPIKKKITRKK
jgi:ATP-dependent protease ClpP protease subunit